MLTFGRRIKAGLGAWERQEHEFCLGRLVLQEAKFSFSRTAWSRAHDCHTSDLILVRNGECGDVNFEVSDH